MASGNEQTDGASGAVTIRLATANDAGDIASLLDELGHPMQVGQVAGHLEGSAAKGDEATLLAVQHAETIGLLSLYWRAFLAEPRPVARIAALVVRQRERGSGVGRLLVEEAVSIASQAGCGSVELTTNLRRNDAHAFYRRLGFEATSYKFLRSI